MNKIKNQYRYTITDRFGTIQVSPLNEADFAIEYEQETEGKYFYKKQFQGKITFTGETFKRLKQIESSIYLCSPLQMQVFRKCGETENVIFDGTFKLTAAAWNLDKCTVVLKFEKSTPDKCLQDNKNVKLNLLQLISEKIIVKTGTAGGLIEYKECTKNTGIEADLEYWCGAGLPEDGNWRQTSFSIQYSPDGVHPTRSRTTWAREIVELPCSALPPANWVLVEACAGGVEKYARLVKLAGCEYTSDSETGFYDSMFCKIVGYDGGLTVIDNGVLLSSVLDLFLTQHCGGLQVVSDFFQINPENPSLTNYVTGEETEINNLVLFQKSDVKRPNDYNNASKLEWTFEKLTEMLATVFNVFYSIENGVFRLEHFSWFSRSAGLNLLLPKYSKWVQAVKEYDYDLEAIPTQEKWEFKEQSRSDLWQAVIEYSNDCAINGDKENKPFIVDELTTDVQHVLNNPSPDSKLVEDAGAVLIATQKVGDDYYMLSDNALNDVLSWSRLVKNYHFYNRPLNKGIFNGQPVSFLSTKPFKKGSKITIPLECGVNFDANDNITTPLGVGVVDKARFNLVNCMLELDLKYDVFTNLTDNQPPVIVADNSFTTYANAAKIFNITTSDSDGIVESVQVIRLPNNGTVEILNIGEIKYTPAVDFVGTDYFTLQAFDNWTQGSNIAGFFVVVKPVNSAPIAGDESYNVYHGFPFTSTPSIFANDTDDVGFTLITPTVTTTQGVTVNINSVGMFSYTPPTGYVGADSFVYTIEDDAGLQSSATVTLNVSYKNQPIAVNDNYITKIDTAIVGDGTVGRAKLNANDYAADGLVYTFTCTAETKATTAGGTAVINADGTWGYTPAAGFSGSDTFDYTVTNGHGTATGTVFIQVVPIIYVRLSSSDKRKSIVNVTCGEPPMTNSCGYNWTGDFSVFFYSDAAGTIPFDVTGLGFRINVKQDTTTTTTSSGTSSDTTTWQTDILSGTNTKIFNDYLYSENDCDCTGWSLQRLIEFTLAAGDYNILT